MIDLNIRVVDEQEALSEYIDRLIAVAVAEQRERIRQEEFMPVAYVDKPNPNLDFLRARYVHHVQEQRKKLFR